jgi:AcrR family transcriptional regulator
MPKLADHDERRAAILGATWTVVRERGLEATTTRAIAAEAGCSLSILAHYFDGKDDIVRSAQIALYDRIVQRAFRIGGDLLGLAALRQALAAALPLDPERIADAHLNVAFAGLALSRPLLTEARRHSHATMRRLLHICLAEARELDELRDGVRDEDVIDEFIVLVEGSAMFGLIDGPADADTGRRLERLADAFIARLAR